MPNYPDDPRMGDIVNPGLDGDVVLIGFPCDEGVRRNGGRLGASQGCWLEWVLLSTQNTTLTFGTFLPPIDVTLFSSIKITDGGDIENDGRTLSEMHAALTERVSEVISRGGIPFIVGGGNDQSYPNACGFLNQAKEGNFKVVNIDAHLDVRPLIEGQPHSGSPFRQLFEDARFDGKNFIEYAAQGFQCSAEHVKYIQQKGGRIEWLSSIMKSSVDVGEQVMDLIADSTHAFISFDLDSVCGRDAPGVSAPSPIGLSSDQALSICMNAGRNPRVSLFDLSEFNPSVDSYRTGKLVVAMFYYFCMGVAQRKQATA